MNIVYLGHFDNTGYGQAAQGYVHALESVGYNVIARHVYLNGPPSKDLHPRIQNCLNKSALPSEYCIQHTLPVYWEKSPYFKKNFGLVALETNSILGTGWERNIKMMDAVISPNNKTYDVIKEFNTTYYIPHAFDLDKYSSRYKSNLVLPDTFKFYTIGELCTRKNLEATIAGFHLAFNREDEVDLIIKVNKPGFSPEQTKQMVEELCKNVKKDLKLYGNNLNYYKKEIILTDRLSENDLCYLHQQCRVFVNTSRGEGFSIPTFEAAAFGNSVISFGKDYDYLTNSLSCSKEPCYGSQDTFNYLYTGKHTWNNISLSNLKQFYLYNYEHYEKLEGIRQMNLYKTYEYSYKKIGKRFKKILV